MSSAEVAAAVPKSPKEKKAKVAKPKLLKVLSDKIHKEKKAAPTHPTYAVMVKKAIAELKERSGSSRAAILKYINTNFKLEGTAPKINARLRSALIKGVEKNELQQTKGTGAAGSFKLAAKTSVSEPKKVVVKKVSKASPAKKTAKASPKKKTVAKKEAKPKKAPVAKKSAAKSPKKATKSPKKTSAAKPKAKKTAKATKA